MEVKATADYTVRRRGTYRWMNEDVKGKVILEVDGQRQAYDFSNTCLDTRNECGPHVRVAKWEKDRSGHFDKLYFDTKGVWLFYPASRQPKRTDQVNPRTVNVRLKVRP